MTTRQLNTRHLNTWQLNTTIIKKNDITDWNETIFILNNLSFITHLFYNITNLINIINFFPKFTKKNSDHIPYLSNMITESHPSVVTLLTRILNYLMTTNRRKSMHSDISKRKNQNKKNNEKSEIVPQKQYRTKNYIA